MKSLTGYKREDGRFGIRNHLLVIPTVICANTVVDALSRRFGDRIIAVTHPYGCTFDHINNNEVSDTIVGFAANPNVGAVLLVGLGCETVDYHSVFERVHAINPRSALLMIQESGGVQNTIKKAVPIVEDLLKTLEPMKREAMSISDLIVGTQCGSSDGYSGLTANPALGLAVDRIVEQGGTAILAELTEFLGAEHNLLARCKNDNVRQRLQAYLDETERNLSRVGESNLQDIAPGNIAGGLTTLEEKSLGCVKKGGSTTVNEVVDHGARPAEKGLIIMDTSGHDIESVVAIAAGGSQVCFFTTGRGSPTGCPIIPVIKVSSNSDIWVRLNDLIDVNAGTVLEGEESLPEVAERMVDYLVDVVNGKETKSEINGCREFAIRRRGVDVCIL